MKHSEFTHKHAWMNGLQEYYSDTPYEAAYDEIYKALYHKNKFRLRDVMIKLHGMIEEAKLVDKESTLKSFYNTLLYEELLDYDVKARILAHLISFYVKDPYVERLHQFLLYFHHNSIIGAPDMNDFFSRGQVMSKKWLIDEIKKVIAGDSIGTVVMYGAWYNFLAHMLNESFDVDTIYSLDRDKNVIKPASNMYKDIINYRFRPLVTDVNECKWDEQGLWYVDADKRQKDFDNHIKNTYIGSQSKSDIWNQFGWRKIGEVDMVINTSCEHMDNRWFNKLPEGTLVCLQTNDYFDNPQHINCVENLDQARNRYPMSKELYGGYLSTELYTRFMLIGIK